MFKMVNIMYRIDVECSNLRIFLEELILRVYFFVL